MQHVPSLLQTEKNSPQLQHGSLLEKDTKINAVTVLYLCTQQSLVRTVVTATGNLTRLIGVRFPPCFAVS